MKHSLTILLSLLAAPAWALPTVTGISITPRTSSAIIGYQATPGAADYRIREVNADGTLSNEVKYAGQSVLVDNGMGPTWLGTSPALSIDLNGLYGATNGQKWVIEAVDALGPYPQGNLTSYNSNAPSFPALLMPMTGMVASWIPTYAANGTLAGYVSPPYVWASNDGMTLDGLMSINGQGNCSNIPNVIARSLPFTVTATGIAPIPTGKDVSTYYCNTFAPSTAPEVFGNPTLQSELDERQTTTNIGSGSEIFTLTDAAGTANVILQCADLNNSRTMIDQGHIMSVLFDGGQPPQNGEPLHNNHAYWAFQPQKLFSLSNGSIIHIHFEADMNMLQLRDNIELFIFPSRDQFHQFDENLENPLNDTSCLQIMWHTSDILAQIWTTAGNTRSRLVLSPYNVRTNQSQLDYKIPEDVFLSNSHLQVYENGVLMIDADIPGGIPWSSTDQTMANLAQIRYHGSLLVNELAKWQPWNGWFYGVIPQPLAGVQAVTLGSQTTLTATNYQFSDKDATQTIAIPTLGIFSVLSVSNGGAVVSGNTAALLPGTTYTGIIGQPSPASWPNSIQWTMGMPMSSERHIGNIGIENIPAASVTWAQMATRLVPALTGTAPVLQVPKTVTGLIAFVTPGKPHAVWTFGFGTVAVKTSDPAITQVLNGHYENGTAATVSYTTSVAGNSVVSAQ